MRRLALLVVVMCSVYFPLSVLAAGQDIKKTAKDDYELQERCGKRAVERIKEIGGEGVSSDKDRQYITTYTNHYNTRLTKCFVVLRVEGIPKGKSDAKDLGISTDKTLWDINENKQYGEFFRFFKTSNANECEVGGKACRSESEWDALVRPYMEE